MLLSVHLTRELRRLTSYSVSIGTACRSFTKVAFSFRYLIESATFHVDKEVDMFLNNMPDGLSRLATCPATLTQMRLTRSLIVASIMPLSTADNDGHSCCLQCSWTPVCLIISSCAPLCECAHRKVDKASHPGGRHWFVFDCGEGFSL